MTTAYLALGSNRGDRIQNLRRAATQLEAAGILIEARSKIYTTESVEGGGEGDFLNAALRIRTQLTARQLLGILRQIETENGRPPGEHGGHRGGPRTLDLDILLFGDEVHNEPDLEIPHPRMGRRAFVLRPLLDVLDGGWVLEASESW